MEDRDRYFMGLALEESKFALRDGELPVGAVVVLDDKVVGRGCKFKGGNRRLDHAEQLAIREAWDKISERTADAVIYTTLEPCIQCFGAVLNCHIGKIVYALEDPHGGVTHEILQYLLPVRHHDRFPVVTSGPLRKEAKLIFREFFATTQMKFWRDHPENPLIKLCSV